MENKPDFTDKIFKNFIRFEKVVTILLSIIIALIIVISLIRIIQNFIVLFAHDVFAPQEITFEDYQIIFGKILTLLISLEFMSSIIKVIKKHEIKSLVKDVVLITALAIARKLIVFDYDHHTPIQTVVFGIILLCIGLFYFLLKVKFKTKKISTNQYDKNS